MTNHNGNHLSYVREFFLSWGLDVDNEDSHISGPVYNHMMDSCMDDAVMQKTIVTLVDAVDDEFYLASTTWEEVADFYLSRN